MLRLLHGKNYDFVKYRKVAAIGAASFVGLGMLMLIFSGGYNYNVEFTGGTVVQVNFASPPGIEAVRSAVEAGGFRGAGVTRFGAPTDYAIRTQTLGTTGEGAPLDSTAVKIEEAIRAVFGDSTAARIERVEFVGPTVGEELKRKAITALLLSFIVTLVYLAFRFEWRFGLAAVLGTGLDVIATLAFIAMMRLEVSLTVVAGLLTVIGYGLNDTIIVFDRIRENLKKYRKEPFRFVINRSINETLPRSVLTHMTTLAATVALLIFAGEIIRPFAWVMTFGILVATFTSMYVASPLLMEIERRWPRPTSVDQRAPSRQGASEAKSRPTRPAAGAGAR